MKARVGKPGGSCCQHCEQVVETRGEITSTRLIVERIEENMSRIEESMVTRGEFKPVRAVAYGLVTLMAGALVTILTTVATK